MTSAKRLNEFLEELAKVLPHAIISKQEVAIVSVIGTNMKIPGFLARAATALWNEGINVLALDQVMRQVNIQFIIDRSQFKTAQIALHREFVEQQKA